MNIELRGKSNQAPGGIPQAHTEQEKQQGKPDVRQHVALSPALWVRFKNYRTQAEFEVTYQLGSGNANAEAALRDAYRKGVEVIRCAVLA